MKSSTCLKCGWKAFTILYIPRYCGNCACERIDTVSYTEWIAAALILGAAIYFIAVRNI